jgi:hypothetical protein
VVASDELLRSEEGDGYKVGNMGVASEELVRFEEEID